MEDYAYVLDVLTEGRPDSKRRFRREPVVYGLGIEEFKIFDMKPVPGAAINIGDRCYIGKETEERTQIDHELIPGLGKKTMNLIVRNRPYTGFREMEEKIPNFRNPEKYISQGIENEIKETDQKYRLFVR